MKAVYIENYGSAVDVLKLGELPNPDIKDDFDMIVKVAAAG